MALGENIRQKVNNNLTVLLDATSDYMLIGGYVSNLLETDAYLTIKPFLINAKIERGIPLQLASKEFVEQGEKLGAIASDVPINLTWNSWDMNDWNSGELIDWNSPNPGASSVLLSLTMAEV